MCNMMMMQCAPFVEDPASKCASTKPLRLPVLNVAARRQLSATAASERYSRRADGVSFQNEVFRLRTQAKISELVHLAATAASTDVCSTNALLAKKALKYRRVLERRPFTTATAVQC
ncbi:uncharacterized protein IUM83_19899 [Phytophthora cinnamomi]|uniref:uncharacterized protein n=1 Tax=Phytophthora cinnamomi TaxID=4785 RepID=UPI003559BF91|nr:hypothetical protein IUM83_19899 [Phytophthora cinnamomi]